MAHPEPPAPPLSEAYHKARKQYALFSGLLLAWELVGIEVGANPFTSVEVKLLSPEAAPYVLIALVAYFGFRTMIEWLQCDLARRTLWPSRVDFTVANALAIAAIGLFFLQQSKQMQVVNMVDPLQVSLLLFSALMVTIGPTLVVNGLTGKGSIAERSVGLLAVLLYVGVSGWAVYRNFSGSRSRPLWVDTMLLAAAAGLSVPVFRRLGPWSMRVSPTPAGPADPGSDPPPSETQDEASGKAPTS